MSLAQWYVSRGRIDRTTWWLTYTVPLLGLSLLAIAVDLVFGYTTWVELSAVTSGRYEAGPFATVVAVLTVVPSVSSTVTRLHDRGLSGWWFLLVLLPLVGVPALLVLTGFLRGDGGPNRYGPPPRALPAQVDDPLYPPSSWS
jgi:uncharacterized membrane protein YhaH (DUF805 family)